MKEKKSKTIDVKIVGISPLLMHRFTEEALASLESKSKKKTGVVPSEAAENLAYRDKKGKLYQPAEHIFLALVKSATNFTIPGKNRKTYKDLIKGAVDVSPECIPHKKQRWIIDARPVVNQSTRGRYMLYRPRLNDWELEFKITISDEQLSADVVQEILEHAGRFNGLGSYRPRYGKFRVAKFEC